MRISKRARRDAKGLLRSCFVDGALDDNRVRETVRLMLERKPRGYIQILHHFQRLVKLEIQRRTAHVQSAVPLDEELQGRFRDALGRLYEKELDVSFEEVNALIGGTRITVGHDVYDGSVKGRLDRLARQFG